MPTRERPHHTLFLLIFTVGILAALFVPLAGVARTVLAVAYFAVLGSIAGDAFLPTENRWWRTFFGTLSVVMLLMIFGSLLYYAANLSRGAVAFALLLVSAAVGLVDHFHFKTPVIFNATAPGDALHREHAEAPQKIRPVRLLFGLALTATSFGLLLFSRDILLRAATDISLRSPWDVVPRVFFSVLFCAALAIAAACVGGFAPRVALLSASALALVAVSVAALVYKVGFGFDPFIHRATEAAILAQGSISPKPFYYVGQYVLVTVFARLTGGTVHDIDLLLVPIWFAMVIPVAYWSLRKAFGISPAGAATGALSLLLLPLSSFAATTPQGIANTIFMITVFLSLPALINGGFPLLLLFLFSGAAATIHPIAGVPLVLFVTILALVRFRGSDWAAKRTAARHSARVLATVLALAGAVALPAMFVANSVLSGNGVNLDTGALHSASAVIESLQAEPVATRQFSVAYDFVYGWQSMRVAAIFALAALGLLVLLRKYKKGTLFAVGAGMLLVNYVLLKAVVQFSFLISYERSNYADRLLELALFAVAPLVAAAIAFVHERSFRGGPTARLTLVLLLAALITSSVYLAYPRRDKYQNSRGWSTNAHDVEAVRSINKDAAGTPYVVLANQSVSAAAVKELGFAHYYDSATGPVFFYPIPTGGPLYEIFLDTNTANGKRAAVEKAMDLADVDVAYYVVSYYWWHAQEIILTAKKEADASWNIGGEDYVFKYVRK